MRWLRRDRRALEPGGAAPDGAVRRVVGHALIAAPREQVWAGVSRQRSSLLPSRLAASPTRRETLERSDKGAVPHTRYLRLHADEEAVVWLPPERYGYRLARSPLFREYAGQILLRDLCRTTEVTWIIEFEPALPGTGWLAHAVIDRILEITLLRLKRDLETVRIMPA